MADEFLFYRTPVICRDYGLDGVGECLWPRFNFDRDLSIPRTRNLLSGEGGFGVIDM